MHEVARNQVGVLGATSLVGECLLQQLIQNSWHVTAYSRQEMVENNASIAWRLLYSGTQVRVSGKPEQISSWICVAPIWTLPEHFDFLLAHGVKRIIVLSSTSRFTKGDSSDSSEQSVARRLIASEKRLQAWAASHDIEWVILRPTLIYGLGRDKNISEIMRFISRFGFFPLLGSANGLRQPVHAEDVAITCFAALIASKIVNRAYNLAGGEILSYREMVGRIFFKLNRAPRFVTIPRWIFQLALKGVRWLPRYQHWTTAMAERMNVDLVFNCADAVRDLAFSPRLFQLKVTDLPADI